MQFFHDHTEYDYYWQIEYDVRFSGDWRCFFDSVSDWEEDFLSCHIRSYDKEPEWCFWELNHPSKEIELSQRYASFNPIFRISKPALKTIDNQQRDGWCGHQEVLLATLLFHNNFKLRDLGGKGEFVQPGDEDRFYNQNENPEDCTFRWRPIYYQIPENSGKLYHPVKVMDNY